jgi:hypothetical protein
MTKKTFRPLAIAVSLLLVTSVTAQASPVTLTDVVQVISGNPRNGGQAPVVQLRYSAQEDKTQKLSSTSAASSQEQQQGGGDVAVQTDAQSGNAPVQAQTEEVVEIGVGDCECGELPDEIVEIPGKRNFLPFIPLVGLICVTGVCTGSGTPTPTPEVPEPATLLLFGTGLAALGASARRRHARAKLAKQADTTEG